jgi:hypothetical protein
VAYERLSPITIPLPILEKTIQSHFSGFRATVKLASHFELIGGSLVAGDSTKLRAQNSKKNNFNPNKLNVTSHIDARLEEYNAALAKEDGDSSRKNIEKKIKNTLFKSKTPWP